MCIRIGLNSSKVHILEHCHPWVYKVQHSDFLRSLPGDSDVDPFRTLEAKGYPRALWLDREMCCVWYNALIVLLGYVVLCSDGMVSLAKKQKHGIR